QEHTKRWAAEIARFDGFVFVTPEYNHGLPAALKNAIDFIFAEWGNKAAGFVSYGSAYGVRAVEQLRLVLSEVSVATVRPQVMMSLFEDFRDFSEFTPHERHEAVLVTVFDQLESWAAALKPLRQ
ncbi:MAG: NADPH-dependent FMN reductase, partial [Candidatus Nanopelagicales bacterium]|nr:NADPH-dependent FMN reductase [Candidatus Nanopelagicales bacterium]